jgi:hypothetical protein
MVTPNPANIPDKTTSERKRIPMSVPSRKLEVPDMPGYNLYWFLESNVPRALQGGYEFVQSHETVLNQHNVATDRSISGNADLGGQVRVVGGAAESGGVEHLVLMKLKQEWYDEDRRAIEQRNASVMSAIFQEEQILGSETVAAEDKGNRYVSKALFQRPVRKGK